MGLRSQVHERTDVGRRAFLIGPGDQTLIPPANQPNFNADEPSIGTGGENPNLSPFLNPNEGQRPPTGPPQIPFNFQSVPNEAPTQIAHFATQGSPSVGFRPGMLGATSAVATMMSISPSSQTPSPSVIPVTQASPTTTHITQTPGVQSNVPLASTRVSVLSTPTIINPQASTSPPSNLSSSNPTTVADTSDTSTSEFNIPIILGIVVASVVGIAVVAATISWILRMRRKEGFCGCISTKKDDEDEIAKWAYNSSYLDSTPDLFKEKPELALDYDRATATNSLPSRSKEGSWSEMTAGSYPVTAHPPSLYTGGNLYGSFARAPTPIMMQPPYIPPPSIPIHLALEGPYFTTTPRPTFCQPNEPFPNPHPVQLPVDIRTSPIQPTISPGGTLVVANLAPGDISDGLSRPSTQSPWLRSPGTPPPVSIPQRPWTESFSPLPGHGQERLKEDRVPLSPLPNETMHVPRSGPVPWPPLNVQSKSRSVSMDGSSHSRRSSVRSDVSSVAPRLPTPTSMSAVQTDSSRGGWAAALRSNIFAALGAVGQMASTSTTQGGATGDMPAHPDAPLSERLTSVTPRSRTSSTRRRKAMQKAGEVDLEEGLGGGRMVATESEEFYPSSTVPSRTNSVSGITETRPSRLYKNIKLSQRRHESKIKAINHGKRPGAMQPTRSASSMYSCSSGYTTDKGEIDEVILPHEILQMYVIGEIEEEGDGGHPPPGKGSAGLAGKP